MHLSFVCSVGPKFWRFSPARSEIFLNGQKFLILLFKAFPGSTMKPYFWRGQFLTSISLAPKFQCKISGQNTFLKWPKFLHSGLFTIWHNVRTYDTEISKKKSGGKNPHNHYSVPTYQGNKYRIENYFYIFLYNDFCFLQRGLLCHISGVTHLHF